MAIWRARDVEVLFTTGSATTSSDFNTTDYAGIFESIEFKEPERNTGEVKELGATGGNANSDVFEEDPGVSEVSGDLILTPKSGATLDIAELFYTYTGTDPKIFNYASDAANPSMMIRFGGATNYVAFILDTVQLNSLGGASVEADGHGKSTGFKVTSAANNTYKEKAGTYAA